MPASERTFADLPPLQLYPDTDFLLAYLVDIEPNHQRAEEFLTRLFEQQATRLYVSSLSWLEVLQVIRRDSFRARLPEAVQRKFDLTRWQIADVRSRYVQWFLDSLQTLLSRFEWIEVPITPEVRGVAIDSALRYNLGAHDATHVASALVAGVRDFASFDRAFRRVDEIVLWSDLIYAPEGA